MADQGFENFKLDLAHDLYMDLFCVLIPKDVQLGVFLFQKPQLLQRGRGICTGRQRHLVGHNRLQLRGRGGAFNAQALSCPCAGQTGHRHQLSGNGAFNGSELIAAVAAQPHDLFFQRFSLAAGIAQVLPHLQAAPGDLQPGQPVALGIPGDLVHPTAKTAGAYRSGRIAVQQLQQFMDAVGL